MQVLDEVERYETDDVTEELQLIQLQTAISQTLENWGYIYSEEDHEWFYPLKH